MIRTILCSLGILSAIAIIAVAAIWYKNAHAMGEDEARALSHAEERVAFARELVDADVGEYDEDLASSNPQLVSAIEYRNEQARKSLENAENLHARQKAAFDAMQEKKDAATTKSYVAGGGGALMLLVSALLLSRKRPTPGRA